MIYVTVLSVAWSLGYISMSYPLKPRARDMTRELSSMHDLKNQSHQYNPRINRALLKQRYLIALLLTSPTYKGA